MVETAQNSDKQASYALFAKRLQSHKNRGNHPLIRRHKPNKAIVRQKSGVQNPPTFRQV